MKPTLSAQEEDFCRRFSETRDAHGSYLASHPCAGLSAQQVRLRTTRLMSSPSVQARVRQLMDLAAIDSAAVIKKIHEWLLDVLEADVNELVSVRVGACRHCHGDGHGYQWRAHEYEAEVDRVERFNLAKGPKVAPQPFPELAGGLGFDPAAPPHPECPECSGEGVPRPVFHDTEHLSPQAKALYGGVQMTNNGLKVLIFDKAKALDMLAKLHNAYSETVHVTGDLKALVGVAKLDAKDPQAAARAYQDMIAGRLTGPSK